MYFFPKSKMKIAYLINQYPKVSHSFIRREILALESQGFVVQRIAIRGWDAELADELDVVERQRTQYVLQGGLSSLSLSVVKMIFSHPLRFLSSFRLALKMGRRADRSWPFHLIYLAEACSITSWIQVSGSRHLHAHFGTNSAEVAMLSSVMSGLPYSFTVHGPEEFDKPEFIGLPEKIRRAAFVVAITSFCRSQLFRWSAHTDWHKMKIVHCGLEEEFHKGAPVAFPSVPRLVCVGRLCEQKGQLLLVAAMGQLIGRGIAIELVLAGDGEMRTEIEALILQYGLQAQVRITGWISSDQVREEIHAARGLVLPSFAEGLPVVIMEAMALRRPVLTTFVAGIPELVIAGENGWLFPAGDVDALVDALTNFLATPVAVLQCMGEAGYQRVLERHSINVEAAKLAELFRNERV